MQQQLRQRDQRQVYSSKTILKLARWFCKAVHFSSASKLSYSRPLDCRGKLGSDLKASTFVQISDDFSEFAANVRTPPLKIKLRFTGGTDPPGRWSCLCLCKLATTLLWRRSTNPSCFRVASGTIWERRLVLLCRARSFLAFANLKLWFHWVKTDFTSRRLQRCREARENGVLPSVHCFSKSTTLIGRPRSGFPCWSPKSAPHSFSSL